MPKLSLAFVLIVLLLAIAGTGRTDGGSESNESEARSEKSGEKTKKIDAPEDNSGKKIKQHKGSVESVEKTPQDKDTDESDEDISPHKNSDESGIKQMQSPEETGADVHPGDDKLRRKCTKGDGNCRGDNNLSQLEYTVRCNKMWHKCPTELPKSAPCISMEQLCEHRNYEMYFTTIRENRMVSIEIMCDCEFGNYMIMKTKKQKGEQYYVSNQVYRIEKMLNEPIFTLTSLTINAKSEVLVHQIQMQVLSYGDGMMVSRLCAPDGTYDIDYIYGAGEESRLCGKENAMTHYCTRCYMERERFDLYSRYNVTTTTAPEHTC